MVGPRITGEDTRFTVFHNFARFCYKACKNNDKAVVGSSHGDTPKYVGEGVALCRTPSTLGVPWPWFSCSTAIFRQFWWACFGRGTSEVCHLIF